jgi:carbamoyl-phosphate synthase large subunit
MPGTAFAPGAAPRRIVDAQGERMAKRVLVLGAGTGASNNLIRSLKTGDPSLFIVGAHDDRFVLKKSCGDRNYLLPASVASTFPDAMRRVILREHVDLVIPASDAHVTLMSELQDTLPCRFLLPSRATIDLCQDKYELTTFLRARGLPAPLTYPIDDLASVEATFARFAPGALVWCRIRRGTASMGATSVRTAEQARGWIAYWHEMRGVPVERFTLSEYLPGRDFLYQGLWNAGTLLLAKTFERLSYFGGASSPSGVSSLSALAKTIREPRVLQVCRTVMEALDPRATGIFSIDLKENAAGVPCITEINAGRFFMAMNNFDRVGKHNMAATYVALALGETLDLQDEYDVIEDYYMVRDLDTLPGVFHADAFFEEIEEA